MQILCNQRLNTVIDNENKVYLYLQTGNFVIYGCNTHIY